MRPRAKLRGPVPTTLTGSTGMPRSARLSRLTIRLRRGGTVEWSGEARIRHLAAVDQQNGWPAGSSKTRYPVCGAPGLRTAPSAVTASMAGSKSSTAMSRWGCYPTTYQELLAWFPDVASFEYPARLRWPESFVCPACKATEFWRTGDGLWMCQSCVRRTSVIAGKVFHRTRAPLPTWFVTSQKNGVSAQGLQRVLGFKSYETAWAWLHKLRRAMVRPDRDRLEGVVEVDETFVGGVSRGRPGASSDKVPVMIAVEKTGAGRKLGRVRLEVTERPGTVELVDFAERMVVPGSAIRTDGAQMLRKLSMGWATPTSTPTPTALRTRRGGARRPSDRVAAQALADRNTPVSRRRTPAVVLPRRVHVPLQPSRLQQPRHALLPPRPAGRRHRPPAAEIAAQAGEQPVLHLSRYPERSSTPQ
jgi:hypothetical protein